MKIVWCPLEPFEQRYTADWYRWFPRQFIQDGIEYVTVNGVPLTDRIELGSVLDAYGTNHWKMTQLAAVIEGMRSGHITSEDTLLFADLWFPGIEALEYISCMGGVRPKIAGILHAGTWDSDDFTVRQGMRPWAHAIEQAWLSIFDTIFVGTMYHKNLILSDHMVDPNKIMVTGLPFYPEDIRGNFPEKDNGMVVFPHRLDPEKHPDIFDELMREVRGLSGSYITGLKTAEGYSTKDNYYRQLSQSSIAVSTATQETFGYAMLETVALGCVPIVPDRLAYREMYPDMFRYVTSYGLRNKVTSILGNLSVYRRKTAELAREHKALYTRSISRMVSTLLSQVEV